MSRVAAGLSLLVLQIKVVWGVWNAIDLPLWDDAWNLEGAWQIVASGHLRSLSGSPVLSLSYVPLYLVFGSANHLAVYAGYWLLVYTGLVLLLFYWLRRLFSQVVAWGAAAYVVLALPPAGTISHRFMFIPLLLAYMAETVPGEFEAPLVWGSLLLASFGRPELTLALPLCILLLTLYDIKIGRIAWPLTRRQLPRLLATAVVAAVALLLVLQATHDSTGRSWLAFSEHYAWGYKDRNPGWNKDQWLQAHEAVEGSFGDAQSIGQALGHNPKAFAEHVAWNLHLLPLALDQALKPIGGSRLHAMLSEVNLAWLTVACFVLSIVLLWGKWRSDDPRSERWRRTWLLGMSVGPVVVLACVLFRPKPHYMPALSLFAIFLLGLAAHVGLRSMRVSPSLDRAWPVLFVAALVLFPMPYRATPVQAEHKVVEVAHAIPRIVGDHGYGLIGESAFAWCFYSDPTRCHGTEINALPQKLADFKVFMEQADVRVIMSNPRFVDNLSDEIRPYILNLEATPAAGGWTRVADLHGYMIFIR